MNHLRSAIPCAPPVTTRKTSSPSRMIVRSDLKPPRRRQHRRVDDAADRHVHLARATTAWTASSAPGPTTSKIANADRSKMPGALAHREVLGVDDRRPPARVPLGLARLDAVASRRAAALRLVPLRPLPAGDLEELGAERLLPLVHRRRAQRRGRTATARPGGRCRRSSGTPRTRAPSCAARLLVVVEAADVGLVQVDLDSPWTIHSATRLADAPGPP